MGAMNPSSAAILVTGGSGFIAAHCIVHLLEEGRSVRAVVDSPDQADRMRQTLARAGQDPSGLELAVEDPESDAGWARAMAGCSGVLVVAAPGLPTGPRETGTMTPGQGSASPARAPHEAVLRILHAAREAGVPRVVMSSASGALGFGQGTRPRRATGKGQNVLEGLGTHALPQTPAERAAWEFVDAQEGEDRLELVALRPVAVFGPVLGSEVSGGNEIVRGLLAGETPVLMDLWFPMVDVRDVAAAHAAALRVPEAAGQRYAIGSGEGLSMEQIAQTLREGLGAAAGRMPARRFPSRVARALGRVLPVSRGLPAGLSTGTRNDVAETQQVLGLSPRPVRETVLDAGRSMIERGLVTAP